MSFQNGTLSNVQLKNVHILSAFSEKIFERHFDYLYKTKIGDEYHITIFRCISHFSLLYTTALTFGPPATPG